MKPARAAVAVLFALALASMAAADVIPPAPAGPVYTAATNGNWNQAGTWNPAQVPVTGAIVKIPAGRIVTVTSQETPRIKWIEVSGTLAMSSSSNSRLFVETLLVKPGGTFTIASAIAPLPAHLKAELVFTSPGTAFDPASDPDQITRGFIADATPTSRAVVRIYGTPKTARANVIANAGKNTTAVTVAGTVPADWVAGVAGDEVVLTSSWFRRFGGFQDERKSISSKSGNILNVNSGFAHPHIRVSTAMNLHIVNLTRNVIFRSETTTQLRDRGHVILMSGDVDIRNAAFINLGRTNKAVPLDDAKVQNGALVLTPPAQIQNRRGRYALHVHENPGTSPTSVPVKIWSCVVDNTPGWGFVNHSSHVDFRDNIAYDFTGAGFVTEDGDELGSFTNNTAIRGIGDGDYDKVRVVFGNTNRPQPISDFAFRGDGFWFQGPAIRATGNVANGCNGAGMIWHTTGQPDIRTATSNPPYGSYTWFPRSWIAALYNNAEFPDYGSFLPRYWLMMFDRVITSDLPILKCDQFDGYGNFIGFRLRFNNYNNNDFYAEYGYDAQITPVINGNPKLAQRMRQKVSNLRLWNNEQAFSLRYVMRSDLSNINAVNRLDYDPVVPMVGAEINFQIQQTSFTNLTIDGWEVAGQIKSATGDGTTHITFNPPKTYLRYANFDTWIDGTTCAAPVSPSGAATSSTTARITWSASGTPLQYLVRYKVDQTQPWSYATATNTLVDLTGLVPNRKYLFQVIAGCQSAPSTWTPSAAGSFNTPF